MNVGVCKGAVLRFTRLPLAPQRNTFRVAACGLQQPYMIRGRVTGSSPPVGVLLGLIERPRNRQGSASVSVRMRFPLFSIDQTPALAMDRGHHRGGRRERDQMEKDKKMKR